MLEAKMLSDYKDAMKARDSLKSMVLSMLRAEVLNAAVAKKKNNLDDSEIIVIIKKQIKQRQDSIEQFTKGDRLEMAKKEALEMEILKGYLPPEMSARDVTKVIDEVIASVGGSVGMKEMGRVMKDVNARLNGCADGKLVSEIVRQRLSQGPA